MTKEDMKDILRLQNDNFDRVFEKKMLYFFEDRQEYLMIPDDLWDEENCSEEKAFQRRIQQNKIERLRGRLACSPSMYEESLESIDEADYLRRYRYGEE